MSGVFEAITIEKFMAMEILEDSKKRKESNLQKEFNYALFKATSFMSNVPCDSSYDKQMAELIYDIKQAHEKLTQERERLARINELEKIEIGGDNIWTVDSGKDMAMLISERIKELKGKQ